MTTPSPSSPCASLVYVPGKAQTTTVVSPGGAAHAEGGTELFEAEPRTPTVQVGQESTLAITVVEDEAWAVYQRAVAGGPDPAVGPAPDYAPPAGAAAEATALMVAHAAVAARRPAAWRDVPFAQRLLAGPAGRRHADPAAHTSCTGPAR